jgi:MerR family transcriptional regulator/heat shock protein HspR
MTELSTNPVYTISVAARLLGISPHLLRVYEKEGFILSERTGGGHRLYSDLEIEKVRCLRRMINDHGMNYEGIRRLLALVPCWRIRKCNGGERDYCAAFQNTAMPCWATGEKCSHPVDSCRDCSVYQAIVNCDELKRIIFE